MIRLLTPLAALAAFLLIAPARADTPPAPPVGPIDAAVAPVALYPDTLLTPLLMAATYPAEVTEAAAWLGEAHNAGLKGDALVAALEPRPWAPCVKALVPFPITLRMLAERPAWMKQLGDAFIAAPATVMAEIQKLRRQAVARGMLTSSARLKVQDGNGIVAIASPDPAVVYIPVYNPALVFDRWADADHPPMFIELPPGFEVAGAGIESGIGYSVGFGVIAPLWGWAQPDWRAGTVAVDVAAYNRINRYGPHVASALWHYEPHPTGYFHITQAEMAPPATPAGKQERGHPAAKAAEAKPKHPAHTARHAAAQEHRASKAKLKVKVARARSAPHRGKLRIAADAHRQHRRR